MKKRILLITGIVLFLAAVLYAAYSASNYNEQGGARTVIGGDLDVVDGGEINIEDGGDFYMEPTDDTPTAEAGWIYFDDSNKALTYHNGTGWITLSTGTGDNTLDDAYDEATAGAGKKVVVDTGAIEFEVPLASDNPALHLDCDNITNDPVALLIENAADAANAISIDIDAQATGKDIDGTGSSWYVTGAGALTAVSGTIPTLTVATSLTASSGLTLENAETITNSTDGKIKFAEDGGEDFSIDLDAGSNVMALESSSGIDELAFGTIDDLSGIGSIAFDAAASTISLAAGAGSVDLTIGVTGAYDSSVHVTSEGTGADAISLVTSAGGMDLTVAGSGAGEDLDLLSSRSITITGAEAAADAVVIYASDAGGGIDIDAGTGDIDVDVTSGDFHLNTTGSGLDINLDAETGNVKIDGGQNEATAINIAASHDDGGITVAYGTGDMAITGTGVSADFTVDGDVISFDGTGACNLTTVGGASEDITIYQNCGAVDASVHIKSNGNGADALTITTATNGGGIDIIAAGDTGDAGDLDITNTLGSVVISAGEEDAAGISLINTGAGGGINVDGGTAGITIDGTGVVSIDGADDMNFSVTSSTDAEDLTIAQIGGSDSSIIITSSGTGLNAIELTTSNAAGDIDINAGDAITVDFGDIVFTSDDTAADQFKVVAGGTIDGDAINLATSDGGIVLTAAGAANGDVTVTAASTIAVGASDDITITLTAATAGEDLSLITVGDADSSIVLTAAGTSANAIDINTSAGGIDIDMAGGVAGEDFSITTATSIDFVTNEAVANQFKVNAQGTVDGDAIVLETTSGGIKLLADGSGTGDITLDAEGLVGVVSAEAAADQFKVAAQGAIDGDAINLVTTNGGIMLNADGASYGDIELNAADAIIMVAASGNNSFTTTATGDTEKGLVVSGTLSGATSSEAVALYSSASVTGNFIGKVYGFGSWVDLTGTCTPSGGAGGNLVSAGDFGIYAASAPTLTDCQLRVLNIEYQVNSGVGTPNTTSMMHFNADDSGDVPDYWFTTGNIASVNYSVNTTFTSPNKAGAIKVYIGAQGDRYIWLYSDAGS